MEDFSKIFTIEVKTEKGWEVVGTYNNIRDAISYYESEMAQVPTLPVRLTSPTDVTIYE